MKQKELGERLFAVSIPDGVGSLYTVSIAVRVYRFSHSFGRVVALRIRGDLCRDERACIPHYTGMEPARRCASGRTVSGISRLRSAY
jgi:hypothetical protein